MLVSALSGNRCRLLGREFKPVLACGTFAILGWMVFSAYGVSLMPAGRASIIAFTMPVWATFIAALVLGEKITFPKIAGLILGVAGLGALIGPDLLILKRSPVGAVYMLLAALSWALGTVLIKKTDWKIPTISNVAWQLLFSAIPVTVVAALTEPVPDMTALSGTATIALIYLFVFPMSFCQWAYFRIVSLLPASVAAIGTLVVPVIGFYSSYLVLNEPVGVAELIALGLILSSLTLVLLVPAWQASRQVR
jgi:drug/metabolite transporter (DMT)-like permease